MAQTKATAKHVRVSPWKVRQLTALIRGEHVEEARRILRLSGKGAGKPLGKVLDSAVANAENNDGLDPDELWVLAAYADEGPMLRRWQPRALGRAYRIRKRTSHITVVVGTRDEERVTRGARGRAATR
ncbi:MAG TPA: 50S ribosomal protein L22 [Nitriliruptorales bacterium]|nr:50S ribosomal protein L22 [Nitriliruptorales bacterium]